MLVVDLDAPSAKDIPNSQGAQNDDDDEENDDGFVSPTIVGIEKGVEKVLERLKIIYRDLQEIKKEIQGLRYYEHNLLMELHRKLKNLINFLVQLEERKVPHMFILLERRRDLQKG